MSNRLIVKPYAAWTDYTPTGPWADGTVVTRNADGVGFTYLASYNALVINPNKSASVKDANNFIVKNLPAPTVGGDAANKTYVDAHSGGGGLSDAPSDGTYYGRFNTTWANVAPLASPALTGTPTSTTPVTADNTTKIATTAYVKGQNYISGNQTITLSGDTTGSGTTAITTTLATVNSNVGTYQGITINAKGLVTAATAMGYLTGNQTITISGDISGSGTTAITATLPNVNPNVGTFQGITVNAKGQVTAAANQSYLTGNQTVTLTGDVTGSGATAITTSVAKLQGSGVSSTAPTGGQVLTWSSGTNLWTPTTPSAAGAGGSSGQVQWNNGGAFGGFTMGGDATLVTSTGALTLATVNSNVGTFQGLTVNAKGLVTAAASIASTTTPANTGIIGVIGSSGNYARADHVHADVQPFNCGQLQVLSTTSLGFIPYNGELVKIAGILYALPSGGTLTANTSCWVNGVSGQNLIAWQRYYVYIFNNSGTLTLDFYTATGYARDTTAGNFGIYIKSGDSSRSLVGMICTNGSSQFQDATGHRGCISWFNRVQKVAVVNIGNNSTTSINAVYVQNGTAQTYACNWAEDLLFGSLWGQSYTSTNGAIGSVSMAVNTASNAVGSQYVFINDSTHLGNVAYSLAFNATEGANLWMGIFYASLNATASTLALQNATIEIMTRG